MLSYPASVACGICSGLCKRAILVPCCSTVACRACAVKNVTQNHKCWSRKCRKQLTGSDIINNDKLRAEIDALGDATIIKCGLCKEICRRGVKLDCCDARACRACAVKEITLTRTCWACPTLGVDLTENMVNDDVLRSAVDQFKNHKIILPDLREQLTKKDVVEEKSSTNEAEATTSKVKSTPEKAAKVKEVPKVKTKFPSKKKPVAKITPKQNLVKQKLSSIAKQNLSKPALLKTNGQESNGANAHKTFQKKDHGGETSFFHRPLPELKPFVMPPRKPAGPSAKPPPVEQKKAVKRQWASEFTRPVIDSDLLKKRKTLELIRQKAVGGLGAGYGMAARAEGMGQMRRMSEGMGQMGRIGMGAGSMMGGMGSLNMGQIGMGGASIGRMGRMGSPGSGSMGRFGTGSYSGGVGGMGQSKGGFGEGRGGRSWM